MLWKTIIVPVRDITHAALSDTKLQGQNGGGKWRRNAIEGMIYFCILHQKSFIYLSTFYYFIIKLVDSLKEKNFFKNSRRVDDDIHVMRHKIWQIEKMPQANCSLTWTPLCVQSVCFPVRCCPIWGVNLFKLIKKRDLWTNLAHITNNKCHCLIVVFLFSGLEPIHCTIIMKLQHDEQPVGAYPH